MDFDKIAKRYNVEKPTNFSEKNNNMVYYQSFLTATDYICNKVVEGACTWDDYSEEKEARAYARQQLNY